MSSSISFKHIATKVKKNCWYGFIIFDFQSKTPVSIILYACLYSNSMICADKRKESLKTQFIYQLSQSCCSILQSCRLFCCAFKPFFVNWVTLRRKCTAQESCCSAFFLTIHLQVKVSMKNLWWFTVSITTSSDDSEHRNRSCDGVHCFF